MKNLTESQNEILNDLQTQFAKINEQNNNAGMFEVFKNVTAQKTQDDIRIAQIVKMNEIMQLTMRDQMKSDFKSLIPEIAKLGIEIALTNSLGCPSINLINGHKDIRIYYNLSQKTIKLNINNVSRSIGFFLSINEDQAQYKDLRSLLESEYFESKLKCLMR